MDTAGRAPRPVRRPLRVTLSPSTAWLVHLLLHARQGNEAWLAANRRSLPLELQMALDDDLTDLEYVAGWYQRHAVSDVGQTGIPRSDIARGSSHDEITTAEAAGELDVKPRTVLRWVDQGLLEGRRVNARSVMVSRASVKALREARSAA
jgi:hypothetical protein